MNKIINNKNDKNKNKNDKVRLPHVLRDMDVMRALRIMRAMRVLRVKRELRVMRVYPSESRTSQRCLTGRK